MKKETEMGVDKSERNKSVSPKKGMLNGQVHSDGTAFDWGGQDAERLRGIVELVTGRGGAIRFGYSRDGQAGSIGVYYGDERDTVYIRPNGNIEEAYGAIEEYFRQKPFTGGKSPQ